MNKDIILRSLLLNADSAADIERLHKLIIGMIDLISKGTEVDTDEFDLFVENTFGNRAVSVRKAKKLLEQIGAFVIVDRLWKYKGDFAFHKQAVEWDQFIELFILAMHLEYINEPSYGRRLIFRFSML